jgi:hypothetical protein
MSLSTSSSEGLIGVMPEAVRRVLQSASHLGALNIDAVLTSLAIFVMAVVVACAAWKLRYRWRLPVYVLCGLCAMHIVLWKNPLSWLIYYKTLDQEEIGFRQVTVIASQLLEYLAPANDEVKYLAIGSSQTGAVFGEYARREKDLYKVQFAGMGPFEYILHRDLIERIRPQYVLLYLSEFDLARPINYDALRYAPWQGTHLNSFRKLVTRHDPSDEALQGLKDMAVAQVVPSYKFSFVYKGYLTKLRGPEPRSQPSDSDAQAQRLANQARGIAGLQARHVPGSIAALEQFVRYCDKIGVKVVVVQGQFHPGRVSEHTSSLRQIAIAELAKLTRSHANARFLSLAALPALSESDYRDHYHVSDASGLRLATSIVEYIRKNLDR